MSDRTNPLAELADLDTDRLGLRPAAAADLRARGDRQRRRRHAGTGLAAAAVVAAVGIVASVLGGPGSPTEPSPAPAPSSTPSTPSADAPTPRPTEAAIEVSIPAGFPLTAGYPDTNEDLTPVGVSEGPAIDGVELCGETVLTATGAADVAGTTFTGIEDYRSRTLLLFEDAADALAVVQQTEQAVRACPRYQDGRFSPVEVPLGDASFGFDQRYAVEGGFDLGLTVYQVIQVGPAVLVNVASGEANGSPETRASFADRVAQDAAEVVDAMAALTP